MRTAECAISYYTPNQILYMKTVAMAMQPTIISLCGSVGISQLMACIDSCDSNKDCPLNMIEDNLASTKSPS